jgi:nucleotide-binding universal stress UspA family protein
VKPAPILICYDGSDDAQRAIRAAAELLGPRDAVVIDVAPVFTSAESAYVMASAATGAEFERLNEQEALALATEGAELASSAGFAATPRGAVAGSTWEGVLDLADEIDASVIVLGTRGLTGVRELVEGSLTHALIRHSRRPVLAIPPARRR